MPRTGETETEAAWGVRRGVVGGGAGWSPESGVCALCCHVACVV
jgi:hypothetical protein